MKRSDVLKMSDSAVNKAVKIQGTKFDRKRKYSDKVISTAKWLNACGMPVAKIAAKLNVSYATAKFWVDDEYRMAKCHKGGSHDNGYISNSERAEYKRKLVASGAHVIYDMSK